METDETEQPILIDRARLAGAFGISDRRLMQLIADGTVARVKPGTYDLLASVRNYCERLRKAPERQGGSGVTEQRERLLKAQAEAQEAKNAIVMGDYVPAADVERVWSELLRKIRSGILAVPARVRQIVPTLTAHDAGLIDRELRDVLTALANGDAGESK